MTFHIWFFERWRSFQMIGETNYATKIATLSDWLNNVAPVFNQWKEKLKLITPCICDFFSRAFSKFQVIAKNWFIALSVPVLIGRSNYFDIGFWTVIRKRLFDARGFTELLCKPLKKRERPWNVVFNFFVNFSSLHHSLRFAVHSLF